jgi:hypothetical protein
MSAPNGTEQKPEPRAKKPKSKAKFDKARIIEVITDPEGMSVEAIARKAGYDATPQLLNRLHWIARHDGDLSESQGKGIVTFGPKGSRPKSLSLPKKPKRQPKPKAKQQPKAKASKAKAQSHKASFAS